MAETGIRCPVWHQEMPCPNLRAGYTCGRAEPSDSQAEGRGFDPHRPLQMRVKSWHPQVKCYNESDRRLSTGQEDFTNTLQEWNARVVFIDPLTVAWPVRDENDNAEADRQMWRIKEIAVATGTLIIALWNMGEGQMKAKWRARGATARLDRVDLALNYTELSETERRLQIVKSRYGNLGRDMTVRFAGEYGFEAARVVSLAAPSQTQVIEAHIMNLDLKRPQSRKELLAALGQVGISKENLIDKALHDLCVKGKLIRTGRGMYALPGSSDSQ